MKHKLLLRQIKRYIKDMENLSRSSKELLSAVDEAYQQRDKNYSILEHAMDILSEKFADRIFIPLERLHGMSAYEGTGIGRPSAKKLYLAMVDIFCKNSGEARVYLHLA